MNTQDELKAYIQELYKLDIKDCNNEQLYGALLSFVKKKIENKPVITGNKKLYYVSAEFLIGKLLSNNLINLGIYEDVQQLLATNNKQLSEIEEIENEPSLGNGGLGRLAACFLDSIATLNLPGDGIGLNYHYGLFKQQFHKHKQETTPDTWLNKESWLHKTDIHYCVEFGDFKVKSVMYEIDVMGYHGNKNKLKLFDLDTIDETIVSGGISFDKELINKNLTLFLYPDDSDEKGKKLRLYQQYFMVSSGAQLILDEVKSKGQDIKKLYDYVVIQINDTHPSLIIPELIRLLMVEGIRFKEAVEIVSKTCAYTNHTILAEALEKWPLDYIKEIVPQLVPIIEGLDALSYQRSKNPKTQIIDDKQLVHMASMDIHFGYSINGVARIHSDILKNTELKDFYDLYPEKFNNKTNGITFRRWLLSCNHELTSLLDSLIGTEYKQDANQLIKLLDYKDDSKVLNDLMNIKQTKKQQLASYLKQTQNIDIDPTHIFDIQVKRLHEYKRQQMNVLYIINKYLEIKKGILPQTPITCIFGAKAAPAYVIARDIIHVILCLQEIIGNDPHVSKYLQIVMVSNYNVTLGEKLFPAADISEQISLASKEASGTGNMKFMINGAVTLGTDDGANVEIHELVGDDNIYIFGADCDEVIAHYENEDYNSKEIYDNDKEIQEVVDYLISDEMLALGDEVSLKRLHQDLINKDYFMTLLDYKEYVKTKEQVIKDYHEHETWAKKMLVNIAKAGYFSSDRTIKQYNEDIWKLK